jgi:predicted metal-binding membrane protein
MALLTALITLEKTRPTGRQAAPITGAALIGAALITGAGAAAA